MIGSGRRRESRIVIARVPPSITPPTKAAMACVADSVGCGWRLVELLAGSVGALGADGGGGLQPRRGGGFEGAHSTLTWPGEALGGDRLPLADFLAGLIEHRQHEPRVGVLDAQHRAVSVGEVDGGPDDVAAACHGSAPPYAMLGDRKSTRLNSSHVKSSYAVFCWKKKR